MLTCPVCDTGYDDWSFCEINKVLDQRSVYKEKETGLIMVGFYNGYDTQDFIENLSNYVYCSNCQTNLTIELDGDEIVSVSRKA